MLAWIQKLTPKNRLETPLLRRLRLVLPAAVLVAMAWAGFSQPAAAGLIVDSNTVHFTPADVNSTFDVTYSCASGAVCGNQTNLTDTAISGSTWWTIDSLTSTQAVFTVMIENNTNDGILMAWAVDVITSSLDGEPFPSSASLANFDDGMLGGNTTWSTDVLQKASGSFGTVDLCAWAALNCTGGGNVGDGLIEGGKDKVVLTLFGDFTGLTTFDIFPSKFKSVGTPMIGVSDSYEPPGTVALTDSFIQVPEPASLLLFGIGLLGLGVFARRRRFAA